METGLETGPTNRPGTVSRELEVWISKYPEDATLIDAACFLEKLTTDWYAGNVTSEDAMQRIVSRYLETDGSVSELASTVLVQATMWAQYEMDISESFMRDVVDLQIWPQL